MILLSSPKEKKMRENPRSVWGFPEVVAGTHLH